MSPAPDDEFARQLAAAGFTADLVRRVVVTWSNVKELEATGAAPFLIAEQRRLLEERLDRLEAWSKNFFT